MSVTRLGTCVPMRPLIGVTTSEVRLHDPPKPVLDGDPPEREMVLGMVYAAAVQRAGGIPVVLPPAPPADVGPLLRRLSGLCLSGGPDLHPDAYAAREHARLGPVEPALDAFELALARGADAIGLPVLGICRGCQVLNVARGGTLHQHLPDVTDGRLGHRQTEPGTVTTHTVAVAAGSRLAAITGTAGELAVNSFHHQAVERLGHGLQVVATSPDGVIEAIEDPGEAFYLGVQWHAEGLVRRPQHEALFRALVDAADVPLSRAA
jgi:putative glutamine amidotransferase